MKVLFQNEVLDSTITALTPNSNYSSINLKSQFLRLKYKSLGIDDTITVLFPDNVSANSFFYGYSNVNAMTVKVYSSSSVLLETLTVDCTYDTGSAFFTRRDDVRWIVIEASCPATEDLYIGGIAFGLAYTMPDPLASYVCELSDLSSSSVSGEGQVSNRYIEPLSQYETSFAGIQRTVYTEIKDMFKAIGTGHVWVDITEDNHAIQPPMYATTKMPSKPTRDYEMDFTITFTEAR